MLLCNEWLASVDFESDDETKVEKISNDSRQLDEKTWWLAVQGISQHALDFYHKNQICAGILYEPPYDNPPVGAIAVPDLAQKVGILANKFYQSPSLKMRVIGVTGTDGKSSLVHFLAQALDAAMLGTIGYGNLSNLVPASHTTPDALTAHRLLHQFQESGNKVVAMEVSSHALVQERVVAIAFDTAVFSNLSRDHLDYHQDMEDYFLAKVKLFAQPLKHAVINIDDDYGRRLVNEKRIYKQATLWAVSSKGNIISGVDHYLQAKDVVQHSDGLSLTIVFDGKEQRIDTNLLARFNVDNLLNVAACLLSGGESFSIVANILSTLNGVPGRVEKIALGGQCHAIIDYAHTAGAVESVLKGIRPHVDGQLWLIFGCGGDRDKGKRPLMAQAAEKFADKIVLTDDNPRTENPTKIIADIQSGFRIPVEVLQPRETAIKYVLNQLKSGDVLLIAGKGHEDYQIIGAEKVFYSDQAVVRKWLED